MRSGIAIVVSFSAIAACSSDDGGGGATDTGSTSGNDVTNEVQAIGQCQLTNITSATTESCYNCMITSCCPEMQACDQDEDCLFCIENPIDSSERCVDPNTFSVYPNRKNLDTCQTEKCVPPCGADGGSDCTPGDCAWYCPNSGSGCR